MRVVNTQVGEGKNSKEKRPSAEMSKEKGNDEGFSKQAKSGFSQGLH